MKTPNSTIAESSALDTRKFSNKSTATEAQYQRIVAMLRTGPKNTMEFRRAGIMAPAARVKELNDKHGFYIPRANELELWDEWGFSHKGIAVYELVDDPWADRNLTRETGTNGKRT